MADFTSLTMEANHGTLVAPVWVEVGPTANHEVRWSDQNDQKDIASASWPAMIRPAATAIVSYTYAYTADAPGNGFISTSGAAACPGVPDCSDGGHHARRRGWGRGSVEHGGRAAAGDHAPGLRGPEPPVADRCRRDSL